jgi:hypothetical protein
MMVVAYNPVPRLRCVAQGHGSHVAHQITTPTQAQPSRNLKVDVICLILPVIDKVFANIAVTVARKLAWSVRMSAVRSNAIPAGLLQPENST